MRGTYYGTDAGMIILSFRQNRESRGADFIGTAVKQVGGRMSRRISRLGWRENGIGVKQNRYRGADTNARISIAPP